MSRIVVDELLAPIGLLADSTILLPGVSQVDHAIPGEQIHESLDVLDVAMLA